MSDSNPKTDSLKSSELPIYRVIAGERVRIDKQDPRRRYNQVVGGEADESYLQEFTDEEELEADARQAQWEADAPIREAAQRELERRAEEFKSTLVYQSRIVAFLDVLGWAEVVARSSSDVNLATQLGVALAAIQSHAEEYDRLREDLPPDLFDDIRISQFSDSIVISIFASDIYRAQDRLTWILRSIISNFQNIGLFVRGGVAVGPMIHQGSLAYGPALTEAYNLEQKAINPRIILCPVLAAVWGKGTSVLDKKGNVLEVWREWRVDIVDGFLFFDFLSPWPLNSVNSIYVLRFNQASELVEKWLEESRSYRIRDKYVWLSNYLVSLSKEFPSGELVVPKER